MIRFECDYSEGCHPRILEKMVETNLEQTPGYGEDIHCETARKMICGACGCPNMDVHFLVGGTQANTTVISAVLRPHQAVVCADTGHIANHESGAIESTGHKVITIPTEDGKITGAQVKELVEKHYADESFEHMPQPAMVYISQPTETGMLYSKDELRELYDVCKDKEIPLYVDGARLGFALGTQENDVYMADLARLSDIFYIGGTKVGALFGEAVCIVNDKYKKDFRYIIKRHGGMLAKGRLLGIQFETLFMEGLYIEIGRKAVAQAMRIKNAFKDAGCEFLYDSPTNQQFVIVNGLIKRELEKEYSFTNWADLGDDKYVLRFVTSWATENSSVDALCSDIKRIFARYGEKPERKKREFFI